MAEINPRLGPNAYLNKDERNVHIWATQTIHKSLCVVLAGLFTRGEYTCHDIYDIIDIVVRPTSFGHDHAWTRPKYLIRPLSFDPTIYALSSPRTTAEIDYQRHLSQMQTPFFPNTHTQPIVPGHYALYLQSTDWTSGQEVVRTFLPALKNLSVSLSRVRRDKNSGTRVYRTLDARDATRLRDLGCRVTGQMAAYRLRGTNFVGLEVAHIFPLAWIDQVGYWLTPGQQWLLRYLGQPKDAEKSHNAMLMRADIHDQFDSHQFSYKRDHLGFYTLRRFEASSAPSIPDGMHVLQSPVGNIPDIIDTPDVIPDILDIPFVACILLHVRGLGQPRYK